MAAPETADPDFRQPVWTDGHAEGLDYIRQNARFIQLCAMSNPPPEGYAVLPGWQTHVDISSLNDYATPDKWVLTKGSMKIEARFTWSGTEIATIQVCYDNGVEGGVVCFPAVAPTYEGTPAFSTTAKHFGGTSPESYYMADPSASPNQYAGFINSTGSGDDWQKMTLVFCINVQAHANAYFIASDSYNFFIFCEADGSMVIRMEDFSSDPQVVDLDAAASPASNPWPLDTWRAFMICVDNDSTQSPERRHWDIYAATCGVAGSPEVLYSGVPGGISNNAAMHPQSWAGNLWAGHDGWDLDPALNCYASFCWCKEEYLDPSTNWSKFFDADNKPKDLGADGSTPTGAQPDFYAPDFDLTNNLGFGINWVEVGTVPAAPSSPTD